MVYFLFFELMYFLQFANFGRVHTDIVNFDAEVGEVFVDSIEFDILCFFYQLGEGGEGAFDSLDAHVIVHFLSHQSWLRIGLGVFTDGESVQLADVSQVVKNVSLVVAQIADGILSEMGVVKW